MNTNRLAFEQPFQSPPSDGSIVARQNPVNDTLVLGGDILNPLWFVSGIGVTEEVSPDGVVDVEVEITNEQIAISPVNDDVCRSGLFSGLESEVTVSPEWDSAESVTVCTEVGGFSPTIDTVSFDFPAPDDTGSHSVDVTVTATGSGAGGTVTVEVFVHGDAPGRPGIPDNGDGTIPGGGGAIIPGIPDLGNIDSGMVMLVVVLLLLIVVAVSS